MKVRFSPRGRPDFAAAAILALPFAAYLLILRFIAPPTDLDWSRADPILKILPRDIVPWAVPALGIAVAASWFATHRPTAPVMRAALREAAVGVAVGWLIVGVLRLAWGPRIPSFVPPEESAGPGFLLNMAAGYGEEMFFRVGLLPVIFFALASRTRQPLALACAVLLTGLGFTLLHQAGAETWSRGLFMARFFLPGCAMSVAAVYRGPTFIVVAHCTAHIAVPLVFAG